MMSARELNWNAFQLIHIFVFLFEFLIADDDGREQFFLDTISESVEKIDFKFVLITNKIDSKTSIDDLIHFVLKNLSHKCHRVQAACVVIMKKLTPGLVERDIATMNTCSDNANSPTKKERWHLLEKFNQFLLAHVEWSQPLIAEFKWVSSIANYFLFVL